MTTPLQNSFFWKLIPPTIFESANRNLQILLLSVLKERIWMFLMFILLWFIETTSSDASVHGIAAHLFFKHLVCNLWMRSSPVKLKINLSTARYWSWNFEIIRTWLHTKHENPAMPGKSGPPIRNSFEEIVVKNLPCWKLNWWKRFDADIAQTLIIIIIIINIFR